MFIKSFKPKSNVQLKASERKKLRPKLQQSFSLTESDLDNLLPNKATITQIKIITHGNVTCSIYAADKRPLFFEDEHNRLVPTVYALWIVPDMIPYFTTHPNVLPKLGNGADLMIPGVIPQGNGLHAYGNYKKDQIVAINLTSNKAAVSVGRLSRSSNDLYMAGGHGPCINVLHVFGDKLWGLEPSVTMQIPNVGATVELPKPEDFPALGQDIRRINKDKIEIVNQSVIENLVEPVSEITPKDNVNNVDDAEINPCEPNMDDVLKQAFLTALKFDGKKLALPLLTSNFYRLHVLPAASTQIDLKQTTYKKFSKFLHHMSDQGFIVVREETKGVEKIISVDFENPELVNFIPQDENCSSVRSDSNKTQLFHVAMTELYIVTDQTIGLFSKLNFKKGDGIPSIQIKKILKEYISKNKLSYVENSKMIKLDTTLAEICNTEQYMFDDIYQTVLSKMKHTYEMRGKNEVSSNKSPIQMSLATRSGNKKVTLISNLESYGIIMSEFAKACKLGAAASTSIITSPCQKHEQLQIQGNQIRFIYNLLTETYKIPPKQIIGLDLAKKEKKKK